MRSVVFILAALGLAAAWSFGAPPEPGEDRLAEVEFQLAEAERGGASESGNAATGFQAALPETQIAPFLGTATTQPAPAERAQVGLPEGVGLTVQHVLRGSPAERAGLLRFDVLHKLDDQILVNDPQFRTLLRMYEPGDEIRITVIRQGQSMVFPVELGHREVPVGDVPAAVMLPWVLRPGPRVDPVSELAGFSARYEDTRHVLVLSTDARGKHLTAKNKEGTVLFEGAVDTSEQRALVPASLLPKLEQLERPPQPQPTREEDHARR